MDVTVNVGTHGRFLHHKYTPGIPELHDLIQDERGHTLHIVLSKKLQDKVSEARELGTDEALITSIRDGVVQSSEYVRWLQ